MLPIWQSEFGLGFAALGLMKTVFSGTLAGFQIPSGFLAERFGAPLVLALGTALAGFGYCLAGLSDGVMLLVAALFVGGLGASTQHPLASIADRACLCRHALAEGARHLQFRRRHRQDDACRPRRRCCSSCCRGARRWRCSAALAYWRRSRSLSLMPRFAMSMPRHARRARPRTAARALAAYGFPLLLSIGVIDSATRMAFLTFLPFVLTAKGASLPTVGLALTLVFAGGAAGKLVCAWIGARIGTVATVWLTETVTALGIVALLPLSLEAAMILLPVVGIALNGTSSVLYGSVPDLVTPAKRQRAFGIFYTGTIGAGAVSPAIYGLLGDAVGVTTALVVVAAVVLLTLPITLVLRPALSNTITAF